MQVNESFKERQNIASRWLEGCRIAENAIAVRFGKKAKKSYRDNLLREAGGQPFQHRIEIAGTSHIIVKASKDARTSGNWSKKAITALSNAKDITHVDPVFKFGGGYAVITDRLIVRTVAPIREYSSQFGKLRLKIVQRRNNFAVLRVSQENDPIEAIDALTHQEWVKEVIPDFALIRTQLQRHFGPEIVPPKWHDKISPLNYALNITQAYEAWDSGFYGSPKVRIAIIDSGVDIDHVDLTSAIARTDCFDATDRDYYQELTYWDHHGTAVAGLAAARPVGADGVRGIGSGCSLISIKIGGSAPNGMDPSYFINHILYAIHWAWKHFRADVICMSFALPHWKGLEAIINNALKLGRGGRGCVIVAAAGNNGGPIYFPAKHPNVIAVTATNQFDEFKSRNSQDGEKDWSSSFGPEADVSAPGVALPSTANTMQDLQQHARYRLFRGTSFAAPQVAGLAALILSANPNLENAHVFDIIKNSADKIGNIPYKDGHNIFFGYGRINIANALSLTPR